MTSLRLLGKLELSDHQGRSVPLQAKRAALLAYLAIARPGPWHRRDRIVAMFWPEFDEGRARGALSKSVYYLRRSGGSELVLGRGDQELGLRSSDLWCDVAAFEGAIRSGALEDAAALYRGPLLEGFHLAGAPDFSHWLDTERGRLHRLALDVSRDLVALAVATGKRADAIRWARQGLLWSPTDETGLRRLLELLHDQGNRPEAMRTYETFRTTCLNEYGMDPSEQTRALIEAIRDRSRPTALPVGPALSRPYPPMDADVWSPVDPIPSGNGPPPSETRHRRVSHRSARGRIHLIGPVAALLVIFSTIALVENATGRDEHTLDGTAQKQRIVLADFDDATGESLGQVVTAALRIDLLEASILDLVETADIASTLDRMLIGPGAALTPELAREIALREGIGVVIDGQVASAGTGYVLTATLRSTESGRSIASFRADAESPDGIIGAIDQLSLGIREELGETLASIQDGRPLADVTTSSLEALRLYTDAVRLFEEVNDRPGSVRLLERALARDSTFAMAWRMLGTALQGGGDPVRRGEAMAKAFEHRGELGVLERYLVEAAYYGLEENFTGQIAAYEDALRIDPHHRTALNNLGFLYLIRSDLERAEELFRQAIAGPGVSSSAYMNLLTTQVSRGRGAEAAAVLQEWQDTYPEYEGLDARRFQISFLQGDFEAAAGHARLGTLLDRGPPQRRAQANTQLGRLAYWAGRLDEGRSFFLRSETIAEEDGVADAWSRRIGTAYEEALIGNAGWAGVHVLDPLIDGTVALLPQDDRRYEAAARVLLVAGDPRDVHVLAGQWRDALIYEPANQQSVNAVERLSLTARAIGGEVQGASETMRALLLEARCTRDPCGIISKALFYETVGETERAIVLYERIRTGSYTGWGTNTGERLWAMMKLGPLYEEIGETRKAIDAYRRIVDQWADADTRGQETVRRFEERITALSVMR